MMPELTQGVLDEPTLQALLDDLTGLTEILEVLTKGGEFTRAQRVDEDLRQAVAALTAGRVRGVQVRYLWEGQQWLDTLLQGPEGVRLVRVNPPG